MECVLFVMLILFILYFTLSDIYIVILKKCVCYFLFQPFLKNTHTTLSHLKNTCIGNKLQLNFTLNVIIILTNYGI